MNSVIITAFNEAMYLKSSLNALLASIHDPTEIIVVDDASADDTKAVIGDRKDILYLRIPKRAGVAFCRNFGSALAKGDDFCYLDAHVWPRDGATDKLCLAARTHDAIIGAAIVTVNVHPNRVGNAWQNAVDGAETLPVNRAQSMCFARHKSWFYMSVERHPDADLERRSGCYACGSTMSRKIYERIGGWLSLPGKWSGNDVAMSTKAWFMDIPILAEQRAHIAHAQKTVRCHETSRQDQVLNKAYTAKVCFDEDTFRDFWLPGFKRCYGWSEWLDKELESPTLLAEQEAFKAKKLKTDSAFMETFVVPALRKTGRSEDWRQLWKAH